MRDWEDFTVMTAFEHPDGETVGSNVGNALQASSVSLEIEQGLVGGKDFGSRETPSERGMLGEVVGVRGV